MILLAPLNFLAFCKDSYLSNSRNCRCFCEFFVCRMKCSNPGFCALNFPVFRLVWKFTVFKKKKNFRASFYGRGSTASRLQPLSSQKFLVLILPTSEGWYSLQLLVNPLQENPTYTDTCHTMLTVLPIPDSFIFQQTLCSNADGVKFCPSVSLCSCYTCPR